MSFGLSSGGGEGGWGLDKVKNKGRVGGPERIWKLDAFTILAYKVPDQYLQYYANPEFLEPGRPVRQIGLSYRNALKDLQAEDH